MKHESLKHIVNAAGRAVFAGEETGNVSINPFIGNAPPRNYTGLVQTNLTRQSRQCQSPSSDVLRMSDVSECLKHPHRLCSVSRSGYVLSAPSQSVSFRELIADMGPAVSPVVMATKIKLLRALKGKRH